ncbi:hypothetical protein GCM10027299_21970 [Larkinella ripae]
MAYGLRFTAEFKTQSAPSGEPGVSTVVNIYRKDYLGEVSQLQPGGTPLVLDKSAKEGSGIFAPLMTTVAEFNLVTDQNWELKDLFTTDDRTFFVEALQGSTNIFSGFISPFDAREPYERYPYPVQFQATDGIGSLKDFPLNNFPTEFPQVGIYTALTVVKTCLLWLQYPTTLPLSVSVNILEQSMMTGALRPPFPFSVLGSFQIDTRLFLTDTGIESMYDVLVKTLTILNATLVQDRGKWLIVRRDEFIQHVTNNGIMPWVTYESFASNIVFGELTPSVYTVYKALDLIPQRSSSLGIQAGSKKLTINYEYGQLKNELKNGDFREGLQHWVHPRTAQQILPGENGVTAVGDGSEQKPYGIRVAGTTDDYRQRVDLVGVGAFLDYPERGQNADGFTLSVRFKNYRTSKAKFSLVANVQKKGAYALQEDGTWSPYDANKDKTSWYIFKQNTFADSDGFDKPSASEGKFEVAANPVPGKGSYRLSLILYRGVNMPFYDKDPTAYIEYREIKITKRDLAVQNLTGEKVESQAEGADRKRKAEEMTVYLGDQTSAKITRTVFSTANSPNGELIHYTVYYPRYGALLRLDGNPTEKWLRYGADPTVSANFKRVQVHCAEGRLAMLGKPLRLNDINQVINDPADRMPGPFSIYYLPEIKNTDGNPTYCQALAFRWEVQSNRLKTKLLEIPNNAIAVSTNKYWQTPEGIQDMPPDESKPGNKNPLVGAYTPGQLQEIIDRKYKTGVGKGFSYDSSLGIPIGESSGPMDKIRGLLQAGAQKIFR